MKQDWIDGYIRAKRGVRAEYQREWAAMKYLLGGKMFIMHGGDKEERPILTMKLKPADGLVLREKYPGGVVPGYYMNKQHWNSLYLESAVPEDEAQAMIDMSYRCMLEALPKKTRAEIEGM